MIIREMKYPEFAERFKSACTEANAPQAQNDLGKFIGVSGPMAWSYRNGDKLPSMNTAITISEKLKINVEWLLTGNGPKRTSTQTLQIAETSAPYNHQVCINLDQMTAVTRFISENLPELHKLTPEEQGELIYALCDLYTDEAAKQMKPATILRLIKK